MRNSVRCLLVCSVLTLTGMRDPFRPPDDPCSRGQLVQWHYRGMVAGHETVGILQDGQKRWYRLKTHQRFPVGWQVKTINESALVVDVGDTCEPGQWTWQREGTIKNELKDNAVTRWRSANRCGPPYQNPSRWWWMMFLWFRCYRHWSCRRTVIWWYHRMLAARFHLT